MRAAEEADELGNADGDGDLTDDFVIMACEGAEGEEQGDDDGGLSELFGEDEGTGEITIIWSCLLVEDCTS